MEFTIYEFKGDQPEQIPEGKYWLIDDNEVYKLIALCQKQQKAIHTALEYQKTNGNPVDKLSDILRQVIDDEDVWHDIVDEPYG